MRVAMAWTRKGGAGQRSDVWPEWRVRSNNARALCLLYVFIQMLTRLRC